MGASAQVFVQPVVLCATESIRDIRILRRCIPTPGKAHLPPTAAGQWWFYTVDDEDPSQSRLIWEEMCILEFTK